MVTAPQPSFSGARIHPFAPKSPVRFGSSEPTPLHRKILIVSDFAPPLISGVITTMYETVKRLEDKGYEVKLITPHDFKTVPSVVYPKLNFSIPWLPRQSTQNEAASQLPGIIDDFQPDRILLFTEGPLGLVARQHALSKGLPFATAYTTDFPTLLNKLICLPKAMTFAYLRWFHEKAAAILVNTPSSARELQEHGFKPERMQLIGRGVNTENFNPAHRDPGFFGERKGPFFLYVGRVSPEKRVEDFLKLDLPGTKVIVGDGPDRKKLERKYGGENCIFLGKLEGEKLRQAYASSDVFVFPSTFDTFGVVMIEALASGLPVAAYPAKGPIDVIRNDTRYGDIGSLDSDLGKAALQALQVSREGDARERCHQFARNLYSWDGFIANFLKFVPVIGQKAGTGSEGGNTSGQGAPDKTARFA